MSAAGGAMTPVRPLSWPRRARANIAQGLALLMRAPRGREKPRWRAYSRLAGGVLVAMALLLAVMLLVDGSVVAVAKASPHWLPAVFDQLTDFGRSGWFLIPLGLLLAAIAVLASPALPPFTQTVLASVTVRLSFLFAAIALPSLAVTVVKRLIGRARPFVDNQSDPFHYMLGVWRPDYASFPSGHATTAFAAAIAIGLIWPRLRVWLWTYALIIAVSRVVILAHYTSDVIAGAVVGVVGALLVRDWFAARRLGFAMRRNGSVMTLPGPSLQRIKRVARSLLGP
jgi:membrane-associated phospholipid phosphatase